MNLLAKLWCKLRGCHDWSLPFICTPSHKIEQMAQDFQSPLIEQCRCGKARGIPIYVPHLHKWSRPYKLHPAANAYGVIGDIVDGYVKRCTIDGCGTRHAVKRRKVAKELP